MLVVTKFVGMGETLHDSQAESDPHSTADQLHRNSIDLPPSDSSETLRKSLDPQPDFPEKVKSIEISTISVPTPDEPSTPLLTRDVPPT